MSNSRSEHDSGLNEFLEDEISLFRLPKLRDSDHRGNGLNTIVV